jgi:hypothetical protein
MITNDRRFWVDTMLTEELGLEVEGPNPLRAALATFVAVIVVGFIPLAPFIISSLSKETSFLASSIGEFDRRGVRVLRRRNYKGVGAR